MKHEKIEENGSLSSNNTDDSMATCSEESLSNQSFHEVYRTKWLPEDYISELVSVLQGIFIFFTFLFIFYSN